MAIPSPVVKKIAAMVGLAVLGPTGAAIGGGAVAAAVAGKEVLDLADKMSTGDAEWSDVVSATVATN